MKTNSFPTRILFFIVVTPFLISCEKSTFSEFDVYDIKHEGCKTFKSLMGKNQDCIEYQTVNDSYLKIYRTNAAFNCCIDDIKITSTDHEGVITVKETEICPNPCDCICLYDLEYTLGPLEYGNYTLRVIEEYADSMIVEFEFSLTTQGTYCEVREGYPWDVK